MRKIAVGTNGAFVHVDTPFVEGWERVQSVDELCAASSQELPDYYSKGLSWKGKDALPRIPAAEFRKVVSTVREFPNMETLYTISHRFSDHAWRLGCPKQSGSGGSVHGETEESTDGYVQVGTIHTHPGMDAFWSSTDRADQKKRGGIHVVLGLRNGLPVKWLCTFFSPREEYNYDLWDVFEELDMESCREPVQEWVERIKAAEYRLPVPSFYDSSTSYTSSSLPPRRSAAYTLPSWGADYSLDEVSRSYSGRYTLPYNWELKGSPNLPPVVCSMLNAAADDGDGLDVVLEMLRGKGFFVCLETDEISDALYRMFHEIPVCSVETIRNHKNWLAQLAELLETAEIDPRDKGVPVIPVLDEEGRSSVAALSAMVDTALNGKKLSREDIEGFVSTDAVVDLGDQTQVDIDLEDCLERKDITFLSDLETDLFGRDIRELHEFAKVIRRRLAEC